MAEESTWRDIGAIEWFHSIRLGPIVTPGVYPLSAEEWIASAMPADLRGKTVLDIGAWDGYFSFEAERRGASRVLAIDAMQGTWRQRLGTAGFERAKAVLKSRVEFRVLDVMDLDCLTERFDLILLLGVYYHLIDPIGALACIHRRLRPGGLLIIEGLVLPGSEPKLGLFSPEEVEATTFCAGTVPWFERCLRQLGFESIELFGGTWRIRDAMAYSADHIGSPPIRALYSCVNQLAWHFGITRHPLTHRRKAYRGVIRAHRPAFPGDHAENTLG